MRQPLELSLMVVGAVVFLGGGVLYLGNVTGAFPSFPYAGFVVMGVGGLLEGAGVTLRHQRQNPNDAVLEKRRTHPLVLLLAALLFIPMFFVVLKNAITGS